MTDNTRARLRLEAKKKELEELSALSEGARDPVALDQQSVGRLSRMDAMQHQAMNLATERTRQRDLYRIQAAFGRLKDNEYGYCEDCGNEIPDGRLEIDPMAECCVKCAR